MADFRRYVMAFAGLACFIGVTGTASAQLGSGFQCTNQATPLDMRAQGTTEAAGDQLLTCSGGTIVPAGAVIPTVDITVSTNVNITSRLNSGTTFPAPNEMVILMDEPGNGGPTAATSICPSTGAGANTTCTMTGLGLGGGILTHEYDPTISTAGNRYNGFQGTLVAGGQVTFFGVPVSPPGTSASGASGFGSLIMRIVNTRVNASGLGIPSGFSVNSVFATISTTAGFPILNNVQTIGNVRNGLVFSSIQGATNVSGSSAGSFQQCTSTTSPAETINFTEGFPSATKLRFPIGAAPNAPPLSTPGAAVNSESMFTPQGLTAGVPGASYFPGMGIADWATRIKLTFNAIQAGVNVYVPITILGTQNGVATETLTLVGVTAAAETAPEGTLTLTPTTGITGLPPNYVQIGTTANTNNTFIGEAVYEVTSQTGSTSSNQSTNGVESYSVVPWIVYTASPSTNSPGLGTSTAQVDFAPTTIPSPTSASAAFNAIPRFIQTSTAQNGWVINSCQTILLYPFITNVAGFDTGIAIANTSTDPFGTTAQVGTCTLNFYGSNAPAAFTSPSVGSGTVYTTLASSVAAGFQGYIIAVCKFQYAHGFAFVTDGFGGPGRGLSQGYLPLVIPDIGANGGSRKAQDFSKSASGDGEIAGH